MILEALGGFLVLAGTLNVIFCALRLPASARSRSAKGPEDIPFAKIFPGIALIGVGVLVFVVGGVLTGQ